MLDLETLRIIWWLLLGFLLMSFAITDGFDMGAAILYPFVAKNETEKRIVLNSLGPYWEGNQVWIILGAGAIFAAWPYVYAVSFSGAYFPVLLLLLTMGIARPVSFKYRSKITNVTWRHFWDRVVFIGGFFPALIFGVLMGNILQGLPFSFDNFLRITYHGSLLSLFNPFAIWCGLASVAMLTMHGGLYLAIKTHAPIRTRAIYYSRVAAIFLILIFAVGGFCLTFINGYQVISGADHLDYSNPLHKEAVMQMGAWLQNYRDYPWLVCAPALGFLGAFGVLLTANWGNARLAFLCSAASEIGVISSVGCSMFPFILPSSVDAKSSLLVWDASSTQLTLIIMLTAVIIFIPLILLYTAWVYHALRGKVSAALIEQNKQAY